MKGTYALTVLIMKSYVQLSLATDNFEDVASNLQVTYQDTPVILLMRPLLRNCSYAHRAPVECRPSLEPFTITLDLSS